MKRFLSVLLAAILIVTSLSTIAFAAEAQPGETKSFTVNVGGGEFGNFKVQLSADDGVSITDISGDVTPNVKTGQVAWASTGNVSGHSFTVTVKLADDLAPGTYNVYASVVKATKYVGVENDTEDGIVDGWVASSVSANGASFEIVEEVVSCDHKWQEVERKEHTCTEDGYVSYECSECGETKTEHGESATGHKWGDPVVTGATCTAAGKKVYTCSVCGETKTEAGDPATGHSVADEWRHDANQHWRECENGCGVKFDCEAHKMESKKNYLGQTYDKCTVCGYETTPVGELPDDVPPTGDITIFFYGGALILLTVACTVVAIVKRKAVR